MRDLEKFFTSRKIQYSAKVPFEAGAWCVQEISNNLEKRMIEYTSRDFTSSYTTKVDIINNSQNQYVEIIVTAECSAVDYDGVWMPEKGEQK